MSMLNWYPSKTLATPRERTIAVTLQESASDYTVKVVSGLLLPADIDAAHARVEFIGDSLQVRMPKIASAKPGKKVA